MPLKGYKFTEEHKKKIGLANSISLKGRSSIPCSEEKKQKIKLKLIGHRHSEETKNKISKTAIKNNGGIPKKRGEWKLIRDRFNYSSIGLLWKNSVFSKDGFACVKCKKVGHELHAHHIYNFSKYEDLRSSIENGITLCKNCHIDFHSKYGKVNNNKDQIEEWLSYLS